MTRSGASGREDLTLALLTLAGLLSLANLWMFLRGPQDAGGRPGLFPLSALRVPPGDDGEFADLTRSDLVLGLAALGREPGPGTPVLRPGQAAALRERLADLGAGTPGVEVACMRVLDREHLLYFQRVRKRHLGRERDEAADLAAVAALLGDAPPRR